MKNIFYKIIKSLRIEKGLKQTDLANILKINRRKISYWENGKVEPDIDTLIKIADYFDITIDELIGRKEY